MGKRGPQPEPPELTAARGNPHGKPLHRTPAYPDAATAMPRGALKTPGAKRVWREVVEPLSAAGVLKVTDIPALVLMCNHYGLALRVLDEMAGTLTTKDERGQMRKHPLSTMLTQNSAAFLRYAGHFGLTPGTRATIEVPGGEGDDLMAQLFAAVRVGQDGADE